jgi:hypothetical protein
MLIRRQLAVHVIFHINVRAVESFWMNFDFPTAVLYAKCCGCRRPMDKWAKVVKFSGARPD